MADKEIEVTNLGPIKSMHIKLAAPGVTVLSAPNGAGKSIFIESMASVAAGKGGLPLRHGQEKGSIEGLGVRVSIGPKSCRSHGEFQVSNLEGKLDLSTFVDPGVKDPAAADRKRIKALVALTGLKADVSLFAGTRPEFDAGEFERVVTTETLKCDDLVEMAAKIARDYQTEARTWEKMAAEDEGQAKRCTALLTGIDLSAESDSEILQAAYVKAHGNYSQGASKVQQWHDGQERAQDAQEELDRWDEKQLPSDLKAAQQLLKEDQQLLVSLQESSGVIAKCISQLEHDLELCDASIAAQQAKVTSGERTITLVKNHAERREACEKIIANHAARVMPTDEEVAALKAAFEGAKVAMEMGVRIRDAKTLASQERLFTDSAAGRRGTAERFAPPRAPTDAVLSDAIQTPLIRITQSETSANKRVMAFCEGQEEWVPFHDLSATEQWKIAIDIGVERVGEGGLLFIPQEAWEGVDVWNRSFIDQHARTAPGVHPDGRGDP